jgi:hypothetical protein
MKSRKYFVNIRKYPEIMEHLKEKYSLGGGFIPIVIGTHSCLSAAGGVLKTSTETSGFFGFELLEDCKRYNYERDYFG